MIAVHRQLSHLPATLDHTIRLAKQRDRQRSAQAAVDRREASVRSEVARVQERQRLEALLTTQITDEQWRAAERTVRKLFRLGGVSREVRRAEKFLYKRAFTRDRKFGFIVAHCITRP